MKVTVDKALIEQAIAGAVFDFAGYITSHPETIKVGSTANASPMVQRIESWAKRSGLSIGSANVESWNVVLAEPAVEPTCKPALQVHKPTGWMAHKNQYAVPVLFNPYTGEPRDVRDVQSDPQGVLIVPPGKVEMIAASPPPPAEPVSELESVLCDPSGKCSIKGSDADRAIVDAALSALRNEVAGCFEMALGEGLAEALAETTDERLKDLVERRLMFALYAAQKEAPPAEVPMLSDEEINDIYDEVARREPYSGAVTRRNVAREIEAAVRRKAGL